MAKEYKPTWQGGMWEQENPHQPTPPPVVVPLPTVKEEITLETTEKRNKKAKVGFAGFLTLIFSLVCICIVLSVQNQQNMDQGSLPNVFDYGDIEIDPNEGGNKPPTMKKASSDGEVSLEMSLGSASVMEVQEIYQQNVVSIVFITATSFGKTSTGTGVIMAEEGYIITNAHVIESASSATVTLWNDEMYEARLVGYDFTQDLAVLKIEANNLTAAVFADSDSLSVGDPSYALGNPLGEKYRSTFTDGMVAAVDRVLDVEGNQLVLVQTTTAINSGNSGGALLNQYGEVVGITTIKIMSEQDTIEGMGFAIPTKRVKQVVDLLIAGEEISLGSIGIVVRQMYEPEVQIRVDQISYDDSNVAEAGMKVGDILLEANGVPLRTISDLNLVKCYLLAGDTIEYVVDRGGEIITFSADLEILS